MKHLNRLFDDLGYNRMVIAADAIEQGSEDFQDTVPELIISSSRRIAKANIDLLHSARFLSKLVDFQLRART